MARVGTISTPAASNATSPTTAWSIATRRCVQLPAASTNRSSPSARSPLTRIAPAPASGSSVPNEKASRKEPACSLLKQSTALSHVEVESAKLASAADHIGAGHAARPSSASTTATSRSPPSSRLLPRVATPCPISLVHIAATSCDDGPRLTQSALQCWPRSPRRDSRSIALTSSPGSSAAFIGRLTLAKFGLALLLEQHRRLLVVGGLERHLFERHRGLEQHVHPVFDDLIDRQLGPADGPGRAVCELDRDLARFRQNLRARRDVIDEADPLGFLSLQERAADQELLGLVNADQQRPDHRAAIACNQAYTRDMRVADARVFGHHGDVAEECVGGGKADGVAVDGGDDRLVELELTRDSATADHGIVDLAFLKHVAARPLRHGLDVAAHTEELSGARQDHDIDRVIVGEIIPDRAEFADQLLIDGIACLRPVQGHRGDLVGDVHGQALVSGVSGHIFLL